MIHSPLSTFGRLIISIYMFAAPLLLIASDLLHHHHYFILSTLAFKMSLVMYVVSSFGLAYLFSERAKYFGLAGAGLVTLGAITFSAISTVNLCQDLLIEHGYSHEAMRQLTHTLESSNLLKAVYLPSVYAFPLGLLILAIGIYRASFTRRYVALILCVGALLHTAARLINHLPFLLISETVLVLASLLTGLYILKYKQLHATPQEIPVNNNH